MKLIFAVVLAAVCLSAQEVDYQKQVVNKPAADAGQFDWSRTNGTGASGTLTSAGSRTINITRCPKGLSSTQYYVRISGGSGTAEVAPVTAFSCAAGAASGTITVTTANTHSGSWVVGSASGGLQEAINHPNTSVLLPETLTIHGPVYVPAGRHIFGRGRYNTLITVATDFPLSVGGVFVGQATEPGPKFSDFALSFTQPDSTNIATYTHWPPAFELSNVGRFVIKDVSVYAAWDGIKANGLAGGTIIEDVWMSAFGKGIQYNGALDSTRIVGFHFWPFGLTSNQVTVFLTDTSILGLEVGRADDFKIERSLFINQKAIRSYLGTGGGAGIQIVNTSFDTAAQVKIEAGNAFITNSYFSQGPSAATNALEVTGGEVTVTNSYFLSNVSTAKAIYAPFAGNSKLTVSNCRFSASTSGTSDVSMIDITAATGTLSTVNISNNQFTRPAAAYVDPIVNFHNTPGFARLVFQGNSMSDQSGTTFLKVSADDYHRILGNSFVGAVASFPASKVSGFYQEDTQTTFGSGTTITVGGILQAFQFAAIAEMASPTATFATLPGQSNGRQVYCSDCGTSAGACTSGGTGAMAFRVNGAWRCIQ